MNPCKTKCLKSDVGLKSLQCDPTRGKVRLAAGTAVLTAADSGYLQHTQHSAQKWGKNGPNYHEISISASETLQLSRRAVERPGEMGDSEAGDTKQIGDSESGDTKPAGKTGKGRFQKLSVYFYKGRTPKWFVNDKIRASAGRKRRKEKLSFR